MKFFVLVIGLILLDLPSHAQIITPQTFKIGYADQNYIYNNLPEFKTLITEVEANSRKYQDILKEKYTLYQKKIDAYQNDAKLHTTNAVLKDKETEIQNLEKSIQEFQANSEDDLKSIYQKKFTPIKTKVDNAIIEYGKENGYVYILRLQSEENADETRPIILYANDPTGDTSKGVLLKLGITSPTLIEKNSIGLSRILKK